MKKILIIGGINIDIISKSYNRFVLYDSNPSKVIKSIGGVSKNILENLVRLEQDVTYITAIGNDYHGNLIEKYLDKFNIKTYILKSNKNDTSTFIALDDSDGDLIAASNDMLVCDEITPKYIKSLNLNKEDFEYTIIDANLPKETINYILKTFNNVYFEAISTNKVFKIEENLNNLYGFKSNFLEASVLTGLDDIDDISKYLSKKGVKEVIITDGKNGSYLYKDNKLVKHDVYKSKIVTTLGAGDAFLSGYVYAKINNLDPLSYATALSKITLETDKSNNPKLTKKYIRKVVLENENK